MSFLFAYLGEQLGRREAARPTFFTPGLCLSITQGERKEGELELERCVPVVHPTSLPFRHYVPLLSHEQAGQEDPHQSFCLGRLSFHLVWNRRYCEFKLFLKAR